MKPTYFIALFAFLMIAGCEKNDFETKPSIDIRSVSTKFVPAGGSLEVLFEFRDKEGDVDDSLYVVRQRLNRRGILTSRPSGYKIPPFGDKDKGEIEVILTHTDLTFGISPIRVPGTQTNEPDTMNLSFVVQDKAKNVSDTVKVNGLIVSR